MPLKLMRRQEDSQPLEEVVRGLARQKLEEAEQVLRQIDPHWKPPPYDPFLIAQALGIRCQAVEAPWLEDAMILVQEGQPTILYRPERTPVRTRFNIFHELAHTLFPEYQYNNLYRRTSRPRLFEPEGQLEYLCDVAAAEFLMPLELFQKDLEQTGFGARAVPGLCARYGASMEAVCLRMVETNTRLCALALLEHWRPERKSRQAGPQVLVTYAAPTESFRRAGFYLPPCLALESRSCIHLAARSKKAVSGQERIELGGGRWQAFQIEALPLSSRRRKHGRSPVLAFFYPLPGTDAAVR
jgi:Zn-dependent peptidase ImmA (M78 family)